MNGSPAHVAWKLAAHLLRVIRLAARIGVLHIDVLSGPELGRVAIAIRQ